MLLLSIDTCGPLGTVAVARLNANGLEILGQTELPGKTYSAQLVPSIREILSHHNVTLAEIATIVVTNGPGSFTGIRIGLSTAKGLAEPTSIPILAVSRLVVLANKAQASNRFVRAAALDASRGELYFGAYPDGPDGAVYRVVSPSSPDEGLLSSDNFRDIAEGLAFCLAICEESLQALAPQATLVPPPTATDALRYALPRLRARDFNDPTTLDGNYLRRSDAEIFSKPKLHTAPDATPHS
jgi:tRNA threonylcarbamoyladenosine biosynthesis protein TsaB